MDRPARQVSSPKRSVNPYEPHVKTLHSNTISDAFPLSSSAVDGRIESERTFVTNDADKSVISHFKIE